MSATLEDILEEIKLLRQELRDLRDTIIPVAQPTKEEIEAIEDYEKREREGKLKFTPLEAI
jgi:hypothetical protein